MNRVQRQRLAQALVYEERGLPLLPVEPEHEGGKEPNFPVLEAVYDTKAWSLLENRRASRPEVEEWFSRDPDTNVGIICGAASGLVAADVDYPGNAKLQHPPTPTTRTPRGHHHFFSGQGRGRGFSWGELKGDGSYVVVPPAPGRSWLIGLDEVEPAPVEELVSDGVGVTLHVPVGRTTKEGTTTSVHPGDGSALFEGAADARNAVAVERALPVLGIPRLKGKFSCVLPGHGPDHHPSAALYQDSDAIFRYKDFHHPEDPSSLTLAEVRASQSAGHIVRLPSPSQARWYPRLFYEAGLLEVEVRPLDTSGCSERACIVADGFALLSALRGDGERVPFARGFAGPWCGMSPGDAYRGICELYARGKLKRAGKHGLTHLWLPADAANDGERHDPRP